MIDLNLKFDQYKHLNNEHKKHINRLIAEATILLYEIKTLNEKGIIYK